MQHVLSLEDLHIDRPAVVTIGKFDGVHRGHQFLVRQLTDHAEKTGRVPIVLTFYPHPRMVLQGFIPGYYLTLPDERARLLGELGVEVIITHPFNEAVRHMRARDFVTRLIRHTNMAALWIGENFALGYQREGDVAYLNRLSSDLGFDLRVIDLKAEDGERVSSTRIREAVYSGDIKEAVRLLGRPFRLTGEVVEGAKRGRTIGFPTANLDIPIEVAVPANGVYAAWASVEGEVWPAVVNIGLRPTFGDVVVPSVEAHLLDFNGDLYGKELTLSFVERLRDEMKFDGVESLVTQITRDAEQGRALLSERTPNP